MILKRNDRVNKQKAGFFPNMMSNEPPCQPQSQATWFAVDQTDEHMPTLSGGTVLFDERIGAISFFDDSKRYLGRNVRQVIDRIVYGRFAHTFSFLSHVLSCPFLSFPVLSYPFLFFPVLSCPFMSFPVLSCPFLFFPLYADTNTMCCSFWGLCLTREYMRKDLLLLCKWRVWTYGMTVSVGAILFCRGLSAFVSAQSNGMSACPFLLVCFWPRVYLCLSECMCVSV